MDHYIETKKMVIYGGECYIPSSKPETQRALIVSSLADGISQIHNPLDCLETQIMRDALCNIDSEIALMGNMWQIKGNKGRIRYNNKVIQCAGSGLVFRVMTALTCFSDRPVVITGDSSLRPRVMSQLFDSLKFLGAKIDCLAEVDKAPIVNWGNGIKGGECVLPGNVSSQFITALLFAAPFASRCTQIKITDEILSKSYIRQTIYFMKLSGIDVSYSDKLDVINVKPGIYKPINVEISADMTSASYLLAIATLFPGNYTFHNVHSSSMQGEKYFVEIIKELGVEVKFVDIENTMYVSNNLLKLSGEFDFCVSDCPNIIPTLAALGAYVEGSFSVTGGSITTKHKSNRIHAMITELLKLGVDITPVFKNEIYDGFTIHGKSNYNGGVTLSSWGDHRVFMSLFIASMRMKESNKIDGYADVICSFPSFFDEINKLNIE